MSIFHKKLFPNKTKCNNLGTNFFNSTNMITTADFNNLRTHSKFTWNFVSFVLVNIEIIVWKSKHYTSTHILKPFMKLFGHALMQNWFPFKWNHYVINSIEFFKELSLEINSWVQIPWFVTFCLFLCYAIILM